MQIYWTPIQQVVEESKDTYTFKLELPAGFTWEEGAHTHFALEGFNKEDRPNRTLIRHMSISTLPHEGAIGITTRVKPECSTFKSILRDMNIGDKVAIFKTHSNVPLKREGKNVYLLSSGVGIATFRPLVLAYLANGEGVAAFTAEFVDSRPDYYQRVETLAADKDGLFYVVGSDDFLHATIAALRQSGVTSDQIMLDKHDFQFEDFLKA